MFIEVLTCIPKPFLSPTGIFPLSLEIHKSAEYCCPDAKVWGPTQSTLKLSVFKPNKENIITERISPKLPIILSLPRPWKNIISSVAANLDISGIKLLVNAVLTLLDNPGFNDSKWLFIPVII